jgi:hypothetical protein
MCIIADFNVQNYKTGDPLEGNFTYCIHDEKYAQQDNH